MTAGALTCYNYCMTSKFEDPRIFASGLLCFGVVVLSLGIFRGQSSMHSYKALKESRSVLKNAVTNLESENHALEEEITKLKKSKSYAQKVLRDKYHVTEPGENIIFFPD